MTEPTRQEVEQPSQTWDVGCGGIIVVGMICYTLVMIAMAFTR